nr:immunoglobulin heavy chain junction region [Macaca mulatta]
FSREDVEQTNGLDSW